MSRLDFGKNNEEAIFMLKATVQNHEHLLLGSTEEKIEGVVPRVNDNTAQMRVFSKLMIVLNALIIIMLMVMTIRNETKQPVIIYENPQANQRPTPPEKKSYNESQRVQAEQPAPQDATAGPAHY